MKQLIALEILKIDKYGKGMIVSKDSEFIKEAIAELEQLSSNSLQLKTCDGCKNCDEHMWCTFFTNGTTVQPKFYCAGYEPKDKQ